MMDKEKNFKNPDEADEAYWGYLMAGAEAFEEPECEGCDPWYDESAPGCPQEGFFDEVPEYAAEKEQEVPEEADSCAACNEQSSEEEGVIYARDEEALSQDPHTEVTYEDDAAFMARVQELSAQLKAKNSLVCGDFPDFGPQPAYFPIAVSKTRLMNFDSQEEADKAFAEIVRKLWFDYHKQFPKYKETEEAAQWFDIVFGGSCASREKYYETAAIRQFGEKSLCYLNPLCNEKDRKVMLGRRMGDNMYVSLDTYKRKNLKNKKKDEKIPVIGAKKFAKYALAVRVCMDASACSDMAQEAFCSFVLEQMGDDIPDPTIAFCGVDLYLVYVLDKPAGYQTGFGGLIRGAKAIERRIAEKIRIKLSINAEPLTASDGTWVPVPGTVEVRAGDFKKKIPEKRMSVRTVYCGGCLYSIGDREDVKGLLSSDMPKLGGRKEQKPPKKKIDTHNTKWFVPVLLEQRKSDFVKLASMPYYQKRYKNRLLYHYGNIMRQIYDVGTDEFWNEMKAFGALFPGGTSYEELCSALKRILAGWGAPYYKYHDKTIMKEFGLDDAKCRKLGLFMHTDKETAEYLKREEEGRTQEKRRERREGLLFPMFDEGLTNTEILKRITPPDKIVGKRVIKQKPPYSASTISRTRKDWEKSKTGEPQKKREEKAAEKKKNKKELYKEKLKREEEYLAAVGWCSRIDEEAEKFADLISKKGRAEKLAEFASLPGGAAPEKALESFIEEQKEALMRHADEYRAIALGEAWGLSAVRKESVLRNGFKFLSKVCLEAGIVLEQWEWKRTPEEFPEPEPRENRLQIIREYIQTRVTPIPAAA